MVREKFTYFIEELVDVLCCFCRSFNEEQPILLGILEAFLRRSQSFSTTYLSSISYALASQVAPHIYQVRYGLTMLDHKNANLMGLSFSVSMYVYFIGP